MTEVTLKEIHEDIELLKRDVSDLKVALLGEGELSSWAKDRVRRYLKEGLKGVVSQKQMEKEFL